MPPTAGEYQVKLDLHGLSINVHTAVYDIYRLLVIRYASRRKKENRGKRENYNLLKLVMRIGESSDDENP